MAFNLNVKETAAFTAPKGAKATIRTNAQPSARFAYALVEKSDAARRIADIISGRA